MSVIARKPSSPPAEGPLDPRYYDSRDLEAELKRTFQVCHECRMCVGYCGSFPSLFKRIDRDVDSGKAVGAEALDDADIRAVSDACWQCKLCYIKCPYTADEGATELLDFPRLMARERAARSQREGVALVDKILGEPQALGEVAAGPLANVANLVSASRLLRKVQEKATGISAEFPLPTFAPQRFSTWLSGHKSVPTAGELGEVVLFATCYGEFNVPAVARAATLVLEHNGYRVLYPGVGDGGQKALTCCGLPNVDGGQIPEAQEKIRANVSILHEHVRAGRRVVVIGPSCGMMMKKEWPHYVDGADVRAVSAATIDVMELLVLLGKEKKLKREFTSGLGVVAYHAACHLRTQKIGFPGQRVLNAVPDTEVRMVEECSAVDGTWGMKAKHYETGRRYAQKLVRGVSDVEPDLVVSDCSLSALRIAHENRARVIHPVEALARAYGFAEDDPRA
ncbi:MAG TPA: heterodisulfide reductase-related iron-sulfur binding cluster [Byssovorax sp.]|jgi:glycerol-3-phosphate dehydrogenase subunit C